MNETYAVITGGAGHIGQEVCKQLARSGTHLAVLDKNKELGMEFAAKLKSDFKTEAFFLDADLMAPATFTEVASILKTRFGRIDFIVNNAAYYDDTPGWGVPFEEEGYEAWMKVMRVNLLAPFFLVQNLVPLMKGSSCGSIVNVGSIYGMVGPDHGLYAGTDMTNPAAYAASKGGLLALTKWLSTVLAPEIRVNTVTPGGVERGQVEVFKERYLARTPLKRMATETDVANTIYFLLSTASSYMTGQNLVVDGGWTVW